MASRPNIIAHSPIGGSEISESANSSQIGSNALLDLTRVVWAEFRRGWRSLVATDMLMKLLGFAVLSPLAGFGLRLLLGLSGRQALADTDIAKVLLNPLSWPLLALIAGVIFAVSLFGHAVLVTQIRMAHRTGRSDLLASAWQVMRHAGGLTRIGAEIAIRVVLIAAPFLAVGGVALLLLTRAHDINYYLAEKPPGLYAAGALIVVLAMGLATMLIRKATTWVLAVPLHVINGLPPREALTSSREGMVGHRQLAATAIAGWLGLSVIASTVASFSLAGLANLIIPSVMGSLWTLVIVLGVLLLAWNAAHLAIAVISSIALAAIVANVHRAISGSTDSEPELSASSNAIERFRIRWGLRRIVATIAVVGVGSAAVGIAAIESANSDNLVEVTGHRGAAGPAPENTLPAIDQAIADGVDWVEVDVQESSDGQVVVMHDSDFMRLAGDQRKVWETSSDEIRDIELVGPETSARVPTLRQVLERCRGHVGVTIELKYYGHDQDLENRVVELVELTNMSGHVRVMSLKATGVRKFREIRPDWPAGLLTAVAVGDLTTSDVDFLAVNTKLASHDFIRRAHQRGKQVHVWTVNDVATMSTMISRGADSLITDNPALARSVIAEREAMGYIERALVDLAYRLGVTPRYSQSQLDKSEPLP